MILKFYHDYIIKSNYIFCEPVLKPLFEMENAPELKFFYLMFAFYTLISIAATAIWDLSRRNIKIEKSDETPME